MTRLNSNRGSSSSSGVPLEKETQKVCLQWLGMKGYMCWRNQNHGTWDAGKNVYRTGAVVGVPDAICIIPDKNGVGRFVGIEFKREKKNLSEAQELFHTRIVEAGGVALCIHSLEELEKDFKSLGL